LISRRTLYCSKDVAGDHSAVAMPTSDRNIWFKRGEHSYDVNGRCTDCAASKSQMERDNRENYAYALIHEAGHAAVRKDMSVRFDVIVGNPPYQMDSEGDNRTMPLYHKFFTQAKALNPRYISIQAKALNPRYISMVMPARWMAGGLGLGDFRANMLNDKRIRYLRLPGR
jgi:site-specific DNA-methyltransferase (adenine-specific)